MKTRLVKLFKQLPLLLCALLFAFSAMAKALSVAEFEMYIYDFQILPFNLSAVLARAVIGAELMLSAALLFPVKVRKWRVAEDLSLILIAIFTLFLFALVINGDERNCHCMGEVFDLNPEESLFKNLVVVILLFVGRYKAFHKECSLKFATIFTLVLALVSQIIVFSWKPADFMKLYKARKVRAEVLNDYLKSNSLETFVAEGHRMIAVYTTECPMCKRAAKRLNSMLAQNTIDSTRMLKMIMINESIDKEEALADLDSFYVKTNTSDFNVLIVNGDTLSKISPKAPTFIFMDGDSVLFTRGEKSLLETDLELLK